MRLSIFSNSSEEVIDLEKEFLEKKREVLIIQQFNRKPLVQQVETILNIYRKWGIKEQYLDSLIPSDRLKKENVESERQIQKPSVVGQEKNEIDLDSILQQLKKYITSKGLKKYFSIEEMQALHRLLILYYGEVEGSSLYRLYYEQNEQFLDEELERIRLASFDEKEEVLYQSILAISYEEQQFLNPYYWLKIQNFLTEIQEILLEMMSASPENFEVYKEMLHQELQTMKEIYPYISMETNLRRKKNV